MLIAINYVSVNLPLSGLKNLSPWLGFKEPALEVQQFQLFVDVLRKPWVASKNSVIAVFVSYVALKAVAPHALKLIGLIKQPFCCSKR